MHSRHAALAVCQLAALAASAHGQVNQAQVTVPYLIQEDTWPGTCGEVRGHKPWEVEGGCEALPPRTDIPGCRVVHKCKKSPGGYLGNGSSQGSRPDVQCDNCECECETSRDAGSLDLAPRIVNVTMNEKQLFGRCMDTECASNGAASFVPADEAFALQYPEVYRCTHRSDAPALGPGCAMCTCRARKAKTVTGYILTDAVYTPGNANVFSAPSQREDDVGPWMWHDDDQTRRRARVTNCADRTVEKRWQVRLGDVYGIARVTGGDGTQFHGEVSRSWVTGVPISMVAREGGVGDAMGAVISPALLDELRAGLNVTSASEKYLSGSYRRYDTFGVRTFGEREGRRAETRATGVKELKAYAGLEFDAVGTELEVTIPYNAIQVTLFDDGTREARRQRITGHVISEGLHAWELRNATYVAPSAASRAACDGAAEPEDVSAREDASTDTSSGGVNPGGTPASRERRERGTQAPSAACGGDREACEVRWRKCAGSEFAGVLACCEGDVCVKKHESYSQCRPAAYKVPSGWDGTILKCGAA